MSTSLYGDTAKGKRPSFIHAAKGELAVPCYEKFLEEMGHQGLKDVQHGEFGADMKLTLSVLRPSHHRHRHRRMEEINPGRMQ